MGDTPKRLIQKKLHEQQERKYQEELKLQMDSYAAFLRIYEAGLSGDMIELEAEGHTQEADVWQSDKAAWMKQYGHTAVLRRDALSVNALTDIMKGDGPESEYLLFAAGGGRLSAGHLPEMEVYFQKHPGTQVVYFHTDETDRHGKRCNPCFLPEWSPDTLASFFYFGDCFAVRTGGFRKALQELEGMLRAAEQTEDAEDGKALQKMLYAAVLLLTAQEPAALMDAVMYHKQTSEEQEEIAQRDVFSDHLREIVTGEVDGLDHVREIVSGEADVLESGESGGVPATADWKRWGRWSAYAKRRERYKEKHKISILIPSKDHPEVLRRCVESIRRHSDGTAGQDIKSEIIVIDNGSTPENRRLYETYAESCGFHYEYRPMEFNFSQMCNLAAGLAGGDYYLFLNDDMEILSGDWLEKLLEFAVLSHVGAVGAKLLYPDTTLIQHAGITNMYEGPAHKLLRYDDRTVYYHGRNRGIWDVIGVTAACLMISKEKFDQAGGFAEELKVAYNDVDLCFRLHQRGWFNVVRNDLILYHHESLSRGNDHLDAAKKERLAAERKILYQRSPGYYDYDPYYSRHLTGASEAYECTLPYENRNIAPVSGVKKLSEKSAEAYPGIAVNETLIIRVDTADRELFARQGETPCYLIDLHAHIRGLDSCDYRYRMVLKGRRGCYEIPARRRLRPDVRKTIANEKHVELSGFVARIPEKLLPPDTYEIWMEAKCVYSRQRLCNKAEQTLSVTE